MQNLSPDGNGLALTSIFLLRNASLGPFNCQSAYKLSDASESLFGTNTNYANHKAQATLKLSLQL